MQEEDLTKLYGAGGLPAESEPLPFISVTDSSYSVDLSPPSSPGRERGGEWVELEEQRFFGSFRLVPEELKEAAGWRRSFRGLGETGCGLVLSPGAWEEQLEVVDPAALSLSLLRSHPNSPDMF